MTWKPPTDTNFVLDDAHDAFSTLIEQENATKKRGGGVIACMCPHCGQDVALKSGLTARHDWPHLTRQSCPGSGQLPRLAESDGRLLWNGKSNSRYYRNTAPEENQ